MTLIFSLLVFLIGAILGSFLNVLIDRLPRQKTILFGRSKCESCHRILAPQDLIPIVSYLMLSGRCRYCHAKIPQRLLLVEVVSGFLASSLFLYATYAGLSPLLFIFLLIIMLCFEGVFFADTAYGIIPDEFIISIIGSTLFLLILENIALIPMHFLAGVGSFLLFLILYIITRGRGMGAGDVKLAFAVGLFLGFPLIVVGLYVAFLTGAFVSLILVVMGLKKMRGGTIAFGPFLSIGTTIGFFFGTRILNLFL